MLQQKYSDISKETERKQSQQNQTENKAENNWDKSKTLWKSSRKKGINSSSKTPKISNTETSMQEETAKNNLTANKTSDERARSLR